MVVLSAFTLIRAKKKGTTFIEIGIKNGCSCHQYGKEVWVVKKINFNFNCQKVILIKIAPALGELSKNISAKRLSLL